MKISYNDLKYIIKEELVSPKLVAQEPTLDISKELGALTSKFESVALTSLLYLGSGDNYNTQTRNYDDAAYQRAKTVAQTASKQLRAKLAEAIKEVWSSVNEGADETLQKQTPYQPKKPLPGKKAV